MFNRKEYMKKYRKDNREKYLGYHRKWRKNNKEKELEQNKEYQKNNKEKWVKYHKKYREENPETYNKYAREWAKTEKGRANRQRGKIRRLAKEREIINTLISEEWLDILKEFKYECAYCGKEFDCENLPTRDHIIPISKGGNNIKENIVPACRSCNSKKHNKILLERYK